jgi:hypothetical protein
MGAVCRLCEDRMDMHLRPPSGHTEPADSFSRCTGQRANWNTACTTTVKYGNARSQLVLTVDIRAICILECGLSVLRICRARFGSGLRSPRAITQKSVVHVAVKRPGIGGADGTFSLVERAVRDRIELSTFRFSG